MIVVMVSAEVAGTASNIHLLYFLTSLHHYRFDSYSRCLVIWPSLI